MNAPSVARYWSRPGWWGIVAVVFLLQVGLLWWFTPKSTVPVAVPARMPHITLSPIAPKPFPDEASPLFLSHVTPEGFSGSIWLHPPTLSPPSPEWKSPPGWLGLNQGGLGAPIAEVVKRLASTTPPPIRFPESALSSAGLPPPGVLEQPSRLVIEGALVARAPARLPELPPQTNDALLKPTVLEAGVDAGGNVVSLALAVRSELKPEAIAFTPASRTFTTTLAGSGTQGRLNEADRLALNTALALKFLPASGVRGSSAPDAITRGRLVFQWRTLPPVATNSPPR
jgi:hypothetical protein